MADFGGNVGLWIGASIFTILEILEFFTKVGIILCRRKGKDINTKIKKRKTTKEKHTEGEKGIPLKNTSEA